MKSQIPNSKSQTSPKSQNSNFWPFGYWNLFGNWKLETGNSRKGFTLIELLVVVAITAVLTAIVSVNFQTLRASQELNAVRDDLISKLRELQGSTLTGKNIPSQGQPADAYILTLNNNTATYQVEADINGTVSFLENVRYSEFGSAVTPSATTLVPSGTALDPAVIRITAPYGAIQIGGVSNRVLRIQLAHKNGMTRTVTVDGISGRITD